MDSSIAKLCISQLGSSLPWTIGTADCSSPTTFEFALWYLGVLRYLVRLEQRFKCCGNSGAKDDTGEVSRRRLLSMHGEHAQLKAGHAMSATFLEASDTNRLELLWFSSMTLLSVLHGLLEGERV